MKYIKNTTEFQITEPTVISLGKFDGIHRGHECLMNYLAAKRKQGLKTVIFTFDIPPKQQVEEAYETKVLTTNDEKMHLFEQHGIDYLIECPFTPEIMHMEAEAFVEMIAKRLQVKDIVVGTDFRFGHNRKGDYQLLQQLAPVYGYDVEVVEKVQDSGRDISSTFIREEIFAGHIEKANDLLGYDYFVQGIVVHGNKIGRTLQMPTANLVPLPEKLLPPFGVYVSRTWIDGKCYGGISNVGCKPTIEGKNPVGVETNLFDFDADIYGKEIKVEFLKPVRKEMKFHSLEELKTQMQKDVAYGKEIVTQMLQNCVDSMT
ncbi:MAG: bifunctional riboflavin kinase/FAD synthetase [Lachnospiraceae bacterium]|nr:bifunctional riboflavin kinase/FAD synthetase [Lachnospiraceae bacterium]